MAHTSNFGYIPAYIPPSYVGNTLTGQTIITVRKKSDLPSPDSNNDINLVTGATYIVDGLINLGSSRIVVPNDSSIIGTRATVDILTSSASTQTILYNNTSSVSVHGLTFYNTGGGDAMDFKDSTVMQIRECLFFADIAVSDGTAFTISTCRFTGCGIKFSSSLDMIVYIQFILFVDITGNAVRIEDLTTVFDFNISDAYVSGTGTFLSVYDPDDTNRGTVTHNAIQPTITAFASDIGSFNQGSDSWDVMNNVNITDSVDLGVAFWSNITPVLVNLESDQSWQPMSGTGITYTPASNPEKFSLTNTSEGILTYTGTKAKTIKVTGVFSVLRGSGNDLDLEVGFSINGADPEPETVISVLAINRKTTNALPAFSLAVSTNDTIQLKIRTVDVGSPGDNARVSFAKIECYT